MSFNYFETNTEKKILNVDTTLISGNYYSELDYNQKKSAL